MKLVFQNGHVLDKLPINSANNMMFKMRKIKVCKLSEFLEATLLFIVVCLFLTEGVRDRFNSEYFIVAYFCENTVPIYFAGLKFRALQQEDHIHFIEGLFTSPVTLARLPGRILWCVHMGNFSPVDRNKFKKHNQNGGT